MMGATVNGRAVVRVVVGSANIFYLSFMECRNALHITTRITRAVWVLTTASN